MLCLNGRVVNTEVLNEKRERKHRHFRSTAGGNMSSTANGYDAKCKSESTRCLRDRHTGTIWGHARPERRRADQSDTSEIPFGFGTGTGQARFGRTGVSGSVASVSRRGPWV